MDPEVRNPWKKEQLIVMLSPKDKARIAARAAAEELTVSEYVRGLLRREMDAQDALDMAVESVQADVARIDAARIDAARAANA